MSEDREHLVFPGERAALDDIHKHMRDLFYLSELEQEAKIGLELIEDLREKAAYWVGEYDFEGLDGSPEWRARVEKFFKVRDEIFWLVEAILTAWTRVSLLVFPAPRRQNRDLAEARAGWLRRRTGIPDDHFVADRAIRNMWMHFDEYMDRAFAGGTSHLGFRWSVSANAGGSENRPEIRTIEVDTLKVWMMGEALAIAEMETALQDVVQRARVAMNLAEPGK